jgi:hypothetical protein
VKKGAYDAIKHNAKNVSVNSNSVPAAAGFDAARSAGGVRCGNVTAISCQDETRAAARAAAREEIIAELQEIEALGPLLDPQDFAAVKFAQECMMLRLLCELEEDSAALHDSELPRNAVEEVERMLETAKTRHAENKFCQEAGVESGYVRVYVSGVFFFLRAKTF